MSFGTTSLNPYSPGFRSISLPFSCAGRTNSNSSCTRQSAITWPVPSCTGVTKSTMIVPIGTFCCFDASSMGQSSTWLSALRKLKPCTRTCCPASTSGTLMQRFTSERVKS